MVQVAMAEQNIGLDVSALANQPVAEVPDAAAGVEDHALLSADFDFHAGRVAAVMDGACAGSGEGAAYAPKPNGKLFR
jgi:hypothetical protein